MMDYLILILLLVVIVILFWLGLKYATINTADLTMIQQEELKEAWYKEIYKDNVVVDYNEVKELLKKSSQSYYKAVGEVREIASAYLKKIVRSKGGKIVIDDDELLGSIAITYDGGNHPEYESSVVCNVLSIVLNKDGDLEFNVENENGLDLSRITTEDLVYIADTFCKSI